MRQDKIKEIIYLLDNSDVKEIDVTFWGRRFRVVKSAVSNYDDESIQANPVQVKSSEPAEEEISSEKSDSNGESILSPMPGTFYSASSPEADPFIKPGDTVSKGDTLCIIEAMKIMNEIESEKSGVIKEVIVENGSPVEFNQPLFIIEAS